MASTVEAQTAEEAKILSKTESCDRKPVIDLAVRNLAVNRNINQFQRLMRGHGAAEMRHTYTLVWRSTATFICTFICMLRQITYTCTSTHIYTSTVHCPVQGTGTRRSGSWIEDVLGDRVRRGFKAQLPLPT